MERIEFKGLQFEEVSLESFGDRKEWWEIYSDIQKNNGLEWLAVLELNSERCAGLFCTPVGVNWDEWCKITEPIYNYIDSNEQAHEVYDNLPDNENFSNMFNYPDLFDKALYILLDGKIYKRV